MDWIEEEGNWVLGTRHKFRENVRLNKWETKLLYVGIKSRELANPR